MLCCVCVHIYCVCHQSNVTGLNGDNRWTTRSINKIINRLIELATPRIFDLNQKLLNYAINKIVVPRINAILTMFSVLVPSTTTTTTTATASKASVTSTSTVVKNKKKKKKPISHDSQQKLRKDDTVYFRELDDNTIIKYLRENPIPLPDDDDKVISMLFNEKFYDNKRKRNFQ